MKHLVRNIFFGAVILVGLSSVTGCSKVADIIDDISIPVPFSIPVDINTEIPLIVTTEYQRSPNIPLGINLEQEIKDRFEGNSSLTVKSAKLSSFSVSYTSSVNGVKLDAVKDARLWISAPGQNDKIIATVENNTSDTALNFTPVTAEPDSELVNYLKSPQASVSIEIRGPENKVDQMKIRINSAFRIQVGLQ